MTFRHAKPKFRKTGDFTGDFATILEMSKSFRNMPSIGSNAVLFNVATYIFVQ